LASYYAQKHIFSKSGTLDGGLAWKCEQIILNLSNIDRVKRIGIYVGLCDLLAYAIAEGKVLSEKKNIDAFGIALDDVRLIEFKDIFENIRNLLEGYKSEQYMEYAIKCENEIIRLLDLLGIELEYLKEIDNFSLT
jgi:hypothetical protein